MKSKNFIIFLIIFAVLLGIVVMKKFGQPKVPTEEQWVDIVEPSANKDNLSDCLITFGEKKVYLVKKNDKWTVDGYQGAYADEKKVNSLINKIDTLEGELRSDDKNLLSDYGISDGEGIHIQLKKDVKEIAQLVLGTKKAGWNKNFVRLKSSNAVYIVEENILSDLGLRGDVTEENFNVEQWIDKQILHFKNEQVKSIKLEKDNQTFIELMREIDNDKRLWKTSKHYSMKLDQSKVNDFIGTLTNLRAGSIASAEEDGGFEASTWKVSIGLDNDTTITLVRGKKDDDNYYVKVSDKGYSFKTAEYTLNNIDKTDGDFFVNNPLEVNENSITEIKIYDVENNMKFDLAKVPGDNTEGEESQTEDESAVVWNSSKGGLFNDSDVKDLIRNLQSIIIKTVPEITSSAENALIISTKQADQRHEYKFSKSITLENEQECHYLKIKDDNQGYCVTSDKVAAMLNSISALDENKIVEKKGTPDVKNVEEIENVSEAKQREEIERTEEVK